MVLFYDYKFLKMGMQGNEGIFFAWDLKGCLKAHQNILLLFFHLGCLFHGAVATICFFRGYMEQIIFGSSCLWRTTTFLEDVAQNFNLLRQVYLFRNFNCSHLSFGIGYLLLSLKEWQRFEVYCIYFGGGRTCNPLVWVILSAVMFT